LYKLKLSKIVLEYFQYFNTPYDITLLGVVYA